MATPTALQITPSSLSLGIGRTQQLTATVVYDDATTADVTALCTWTSSDSAVLGVVGGLVTALASGSATIGASYTEATAEVKTALLSDNFNRTPGALGDPWQDCSWGEALVIKNANENGEFYSGFTPTSGFACKTDPGNDHGAVDVPAAAIVNLSFNNKQYAKVRTLTGNNNAGGNLRDGIGIRADASGANCYFVRYNGNVGLKYGIKNGSTWTEIGSTAGNNFPAGTAISIEADGNVITIKVDGKTFTEYWGLSSVPQDAAHMGVFTNASLASGKAILFANTETTFGQYAYAFDDFEAGDWRGGTATVTANVSGSTHTAVPRFRLNGPFESSLKSTEALSQLLGTFAGLLTWSQGQWVMSFAALKEPVIDLYDADALGPIQYQAAVSLRDKCNAVKGVYISPDNEWQPSDFPAYINPKYVAEDSGKYGTTDKGRWLTSTLYHVNDAVVNGSNCWVCKVEHTADAAKEPGNGAESATYWDAVMNIIWRDIRLPFTLYASEAQRLAKYECVRSRQKPCKYIAGPRAYAVIPGEIVTLTHARFGWDKKRFEVVSTSLEIVQGETGPELHVPLVLREDDPEGYGWIKTLEQRDPTPPGPITVTIPV